MPLYKVNTKIMEDLSKIETILKKQMGDEPAALSIEIVESPLCQQSDISKTYKLFLAKSKSKRSRSYARSNGVLLTSSQSMTTQRVQWNGGFHGMVLQTLTR